MTAIGLTTYETEMLVALTAGMLGALGLLGGFWAVTTSPRARANPGDAVIALGLVCCMVAAHACSRDATGLALAAGVALLRTVFAAGHAIDERHNPTRPERGLSDEQRAARRRRRDRAVAMEAVRRYEEMLAERADRAPRQAPDPARTYEAANDTGPQLPPPWIDAEFTDVDERDAPAPDGQAPDEIVVRFETPIDAGDIAKRPERARQAMEAIIAQLGDGSRIVGIRAKR